MSPKKISIAALCLVALSISFCKPEKQQKGIISPENDITEVPALPEQPEDYPESSNDNLAALGRVLFYDKHLSLNNNVSCGSCHKQEHAFCDNLQFSPGTDEINTDRNTPSLFARNGRLFWDGRVRSFEDLALRPVQNKVEMNIGSIDYLIGRIEGISYYNQLFKKAFPGITKIDSNKVRRALAEFLRNFNFSDNKFHRSMSGGARLNQSEELGRSLFFGKARCSNCHHIRGDEMGGNRGYGQTDEHHNIGLDEQSDDRGVANVTGNHQDEGAFVMPVLLNIEYTAPYMHDGRFKTLEEVVEHYNSEVKQHPRLDRILMNGSRPMKLNLTETEKKGLVDFLKTLSDPNILADKRFSNPFVPITQ